MRIRIMVLCLEPFFCHHIPLGSVMGAAARSRSRKHLRLSRVTKDYATTIRQTYAFAAHRLFQQRLHALQLNHHEAEFTVFLASEALPSCRGRCSCAEPLEEGPDLHDRKARLASESDETQVELRLRRETPLAALPESRREDSRLLIETNRRGTETCTPGDFSNSHFSLDLKCALRFSIPSLEAARKFSEREGHEPNPIQAITDDCKNRRVAGFQQRVVVARGIRYRPHRPVEIHAVLQSGQCMCLGLGCRHNHSTGCMARVRRPDAIHGAMMPARVRCCCLGDKCTARAVVAGKG